MSFLLAVLVADLVLASFLTRAMFKEMDDVEMFLGVVVGVLLIVSHIGVMIAHRCIMLPAVFSCV